MEDFRKRSFLGSVEDLKTKLWDNYGIAVEWTGAPFEGGTKWFFGNLEWNSQCGLWNVKAESTWTEEWVRLRKAMLDLSEKNRAEIKGILGQDGKDLTRLVKAVEAGNAASKGCLYGSWSRWG